MTNEAIEAKVTQMEKDIGEIKSDVKAMPQQIAGAIQDTLDLKIKLAINEAERKYQSKFIGMLLAIIGEGVGLIVSFFIG